MSGLPDHNNNNKIIVESTVIDRLSQLTKVQKEQVSLAFKGATIRGFDIAGIPVYIKSKTGLDVSHKFIARIRKVEILENRKWYIHLAKDKFAYISVYRKCIDELDELRQECWLLIMKKEVDYPTKVQALREIHNIIKTQVLLIRDLPFIMNLSKYYDVKLLDPKAESLQKLANNNNFNDIKEGRTKEHPLNSHLHKTIFNAINNPTSVTPSLPHQIIADSNEKKAELLKNVDDDIMIEMQSQLHGLGEHDKEVIRQEEEDTKRRQDIALETTIKEFEDTLKDEYKNTGHLSIDKVREIQEKAQSSINYMDSIIGEKERESVRKLREISD